MLTASAALSHCLGVHLALFLIAVPLLLRRWRKNKEWVMLPFTTIMFILGTTYIGANTKVTELAFIDNRNFPGGPNIYLLANYNVAPHVLLNTMGAISLWIADGLLVILGIHSTHWTSVNHFPDLSMPHHFQSSLLDPAHPRTLIFGQLRWVFPVASFRGNTKLTAYSVFGILALVEVNLPLSNAWTALSRKFALAYFTLSLSLNAVLTLLITARLLMYRHRARVQLGVNHGTPYTSIAAMLVESSALYSTVSLIFIISYARNSPIQNLVLPILGQVQVSITFYHI